MSKPIYYVREWRLIAGLTQGELAAKVGVTRHSIVSHETGEYTPAKRTAERLAEALGVSQKTLRTNPFSRFPSYWTYRTKEN